MFVIEIYLTFNLVGIIIYFIKLIIIRLDQFLYHYINIITGPIDSEAVDSLILSVFLKLSSMSL